MYLEKIELQGFKSFAQKTVLKFNQGITAIVGPNGSGKSNIAEAIKWVLGEQSMKALRSKKSEDIIFAGSKKRARLGMAEVSLYLNNEDNKAPIDYSYLVITRRLFRNGESEYFLNKNKVRLLDIQQILAQAGFGQKTYSVIGQGMIDHFLRSSPKERRELFEEAAGVKQYQIKRNLSLNKLTQTKQNLIRVSDLIEEIKPRLRSLKRQAGRARRKGEIENKLKEIEKKYFNHQWNLISKKRKIVLDNIDQYRIKTERIQEEIKEMEKNLTKFIEETGFVLIKEEQERVKFLQQEKARLQEKLAILSGRLQVEREKNIPSDARELIYYLEKKDKEIGSKKAEVFSLNNNLEALTKRLNEETEKEKKVLDKIKEYQKKIIDQDNLQPGSYLEEIRTNLEEIYQNQKELLKRLEDAKDITDIKRLKEKSREYIQKTKTLLTKVINIINKQAQTEIDQEKGINIQARINTLLEEKTRLEERISQTKIQMAVLQAKKETIENQIRADNNEKELLQRKVDNIKQEKKDESVILQLEEERSEVEKKLNGLKEELDEYEKKMDRAREEREERKKQAVIFENKYRNNQAELNKALDRLRELEIEKAKIDNKKTLLLDEINNDFGRENAKNLIEEFENKPINLTPAKEKEFQEIITKLKRQVIQIGEIDPNVIKECEECENRFNFLSSQKKDSEKAIESLNRIIKELDKKILEDFNRAIENINKRFQEYFTILFGGGRAKLIKKRYSNETDTVVNSQETNNIQPTVDKNKQKTDSLEEIYIEVKANPPGKKLQDLNMLSGGEKALTSIALILAIIVYNSPPFIVFDEVDAALDEANSVRYAKIIDSMAKQTQFITITHNREAMKKAPLIYGVTMDESGISKLLSLNLEKIKEKNLVAS